MSVNLSSWNTSYIDHNVYLFNNCTQLSVNLSNWIAIYVERKDNMFSSINNNFTYCIKDTTSIISIFNELNLLSNAKRDCSSDCYSTTHRLNILSNECDITNCGQNDDKIYEYNNLCYEICPKRTKISSEDEYICLDFSCDLFYDFEQKGCLLEIPIGFYLENETSKTINKCHSKCSTCSKESMEYNLCETCNIDEEYYPKINDTLNIYPFINCYKGSFGGYYLDNNDKIYKPCYSSCEACSESGDENNHNCLTCKSGYIFKELFLDDKNCYENCTFYYYFDSNNKYQCTLSDECPGEYILIKNKSKCIDKCTKDDIYKYEYSSQCLKKCPENTKISEKDQYKCEEIISSEEIEIKYKEDIQFYEFSSNSRPNEKLIDISIINFSNILKNEKTQEQVEKKSFNENACDEAVNNLKDNLLGGKMNDTISDLIKGNQKSITIMEDKEKGVSIELTTTENENNENKNRSTINLGECENRLKDHYNIDKNLSLLILKIDVLNEGFLIPKIEYEV